MRRIAITASIVIAVTPVAGVFLIGKSRAPSREVCVVLWNAPHNAAVQAGVVARGYTTADIHGAHVEGHYEGCFASFVGAVGEPWAFYSAARIPGEDRPLRWQLDWRGSQWGIDIPVPEPEPEPNAVVRPNGSLSLREVILRDRHVNAAAKSEVISPGVSQAPGWT